MRLLQTKLLAAVVWKRGCQPFSCQSSQNVTHCRKEICWTSKESIPTIPFWNSKHPIPKKSLRFLRAAVRSAISALNYGCIMPIPSLQLQKKPALCTEVIVSKIWIKGYDCALTSDMWLLQTSEQLSSLSFSQQCVGSGAASLSATHVRKMWCVAERGVVRHACQRNPSLLWNLSLHSLPEAWGSWERQHAPPGLQYACIMAIPSLQVQKKAPVSCGEAKWSARFVMYNTVIVPSVVLWDCCKPMFVERAFGNLTKPEKADFSVQAEIMARKKMQV